MIEASAAEENANLVSTIWTAHDKDYEPQTGDEALTQDHEPRSDVSVMMEGSNDHELKSVQKIYTEEADDRKPQSTGVASAQEI